MLLTVDNLSISYATPSGPALAVRDVSLQVARGETLGIVGESGSGKSTLASAMIGYLAPAASLSGGGVFLDGADLLRMRLGALQKVRGRRIAMVHQNPQSTLNPALRVGSQIAEVIRHHAGLSHQAAWQQAIEFLGLVNLPDPARVALRYPHELSGGQRQRVGIAIAISLDPDVLILDEPTTSLDVTTEAVILDLLREIKTRVGSGLVFISHNLGVIAQMADRVAVMYAGEIVEDSAVVELFRQPRHPYTRALLKCVPRPGATKHNAGLNAIPGAIPRLTALPSGCAFRPRCGLAADVCKSHPPLSAIDSGHYARCFRSRDVMTPQDTDAAPAGRSSRMPAGDDLLRARAVRKTFRESGDLQIWRAARIQAVAGVNFAMGENQIVGLVGESGSGKTTLLRCIAGLERPEEGIISFIGEDLPGNVRNRPFETLRLLQMVFQDPQSTLNPRFTVGGNLLRHLKGLQRLATAEAQARIQASLEGVRLDPDYVARYPDELSGGEKQRVAIARAFLGEPRLILCDEPLSALDVSVQASILQLLLDLQAASGASYLLVSHDLAVVRYIADDIAVMYLGRLVEMGSSQSFDCPPLHPYSEALLSAQSLPDPERNRHQIRLEGAVPNPASPPSGCVFHTRCPRKLGPICEQIEPPWHGTASGRRYCCHIPPSDLSVLQSQRGQFVPRHDIQAAIEQ